MGKMLLDWLPFLIWSGFVGIVLALEIGICYESDSSTATYVVQYYPVERICEIDWQTYPPRSVFGDELAEVLYRTDRLALDVLLKP